MADDPSTSIDAEPTGGTLSQARATFEADRAVLKAENDTYAATRAEDLATLDTAVDGVLASEAGLARLGDDNLQNDGEAILSGITFGNFGLTQEKDAAEKEIEHNQGVEDLADHEVAQHQADHYARVATLSDKLDGDLSAMDPNDKLSALTEARADLVAAPVYAWGRSTDGIKEAQLADFDHKYKAEMDAGTATAPSGASGHAVSTPADPSTSSATDPTASLDDQVAAGPTTTSGPAHPAAADALHFAPTAAPDGSTAPATGDHDDPLAGQHCATSASDSGPDHPVDDPPSGPTDSHPGTETQADVPSFAGFDTPSADHDTTDHTTLDTTPADHDTVDHDPATSGAIVDHHSGQ